MKLPRIYLRYEPARVPPNGVDRNTPYYMDVAFYCDPRGAVKLHRVAWDAVYRPKRKANRVTFSDIEFRPTWLPKLIHAPAGAGFPSSASPPSAHTSKKVAA